MTEARTSRRVSHFWASSIPMNKADRIHHDKRIKRRKPGQFDPTCRPHGGGRGRPCPICERNRLFKHTLRVHAVVMTQDPDFPARFVGAV